MILIVNLDAMPRHMIQVSNATCASTAVQSRETSSAIVKLGTAFTLMGTANISAHLRIANMASGGTKEAFEDDWIMPNMSRNSTQDRMRQYCEELDF